MHVVVDVILIGGAIGLPETGLESIAGNLYLIHEYGIDVDIGDVDEGGIYE
jgi:hypothetical protein